MRRYLVDVFITLAVFAIILLGIILGNVYPEYTTIFWGIFIVLIIALILIYLIIKKQC